MSNAARSKHILFIAPSFREACTGISPLQPSTISLFLNLFFSYFLPRAGRTPPAFGPFASTITDLPAPFLDPMSGNPRAMEGADRNQGMIIVVASPNIGPGDWKSAAQSDPLPAPPVKPQPAPSRAMNSRS